MAIRKGGSVQSRINMVVYGGHGAGKSTYALNSMYLKTEDGRPFRVLYIDNENSSIDDYIDNLIADGINVDNLLIAYTTSMEKTREYIKTASAKKPFFDDDGEVILDADGKPFVADMIVVDGTSVLYKSSVQARREFSKKRASVRASKKDEITASEKFVMIDGADIELKDYSAINYDGQSLVLDLTASNLHYILTAREKEIMEKKLIKVNGVDKEISINTGKYDIEGLKGLDFNAKTVARLYRDENDPSVVKMMLSKDRTGTYETHVPIEDPSILAYQKMINRNKGRVAFAPKNTMAEDIKREMEKVERETIGTTIAEAESKVTVDEAVASVEVNDTQKIAFDELSAEAKSVVDGLTSLQKETFKNYLMEAGFKSISRKAITGYSKMQLFYDLAVKASQTNA